MRHRSKRSGAAPLIFAMRLRRKTSGSTNHVEIRNTENTKVILTQFAIKSRSILRGAAASRDC